MSISIIAAAAENNVIGKDNSLIWHISEDLKRFKKLTSGHTVIMGQNTYESLPIRPLPKRKNIVLTFDKNLKFENAIMVHSIEEALEHCNYNEEIFICGGASIYKQFLLLADKIYLTRVHKTFDGDTYFPEINLNEWQLAESKENIIDEKSGLTYSFLNYKKK